MGRALRYLTGGLLAFGLSSSTGERNYFEDAAHIPPDYCEDEVRERLGPEAGKAVLQDLVELQQNNPPTARDNVARSRRLPPIPEGLDRVEDYVLESLWVVDKFELPYSGIDITYLSNQDDLVIDPEALDNAIYNTLSRPDPNSTLQQETYRCMLEGIYTDRRLERLTLGVAYISGACIREDWLVPYGEGPCVTAGRYQPSTRLIMIAPSGATPDRLDSSLGHELGHAINYSLHNASMSDKKREHFADTFESIYVNFARENNLPNIFVQAD